MSKIEYYLNKIKGIALDVDGVLSPSTCSLSLSGHPVRMGNVKDGYAMQLALKAGMNIAVITGGESTEIANRMKLLGVTNLWQNVPDKLPVLKKWMEDSGLRPEEVAFMGDDIPDLRCMRHVGLPCAPYDAAWEVKQEAVYVSTITGGYGCVRDLLEQVMRAHGLWWPDNENALTW